MIDPNDIRYKHEVLDLLEKDYHSIFGNNPTFVHLASFLLGYLTARAQLNLSDFSEDTENFYNWLRDKNEKYFEVFIKEDIRGVASYHKFFELYNQYKSEYYGNGE
jgi:hypothetical protein